MSPIAYAPPSPTLPRLSLLTLVPTHVPPTALHSKFKTAAKTAMSLCLLTTSAPPVEPPATFRQHLRQYLRQRSGNISDNISGNHAPSISPYAPSLRRWVPGSGRALRREAPIDGRAPAAVSTASRSSPCPPFSPHRQHFRQYLRQHIVRHPRHTAPSLEGRGQGVRQKTSKIRQYLRQHFWFIDAHAPRVVHIQKYACAYNVVRRHTIQPLRSANMASHDMWPRRGDSAASWALFISGDTPVKLHPMQQITINRTAAASCGDER